MSWQAGWRERLWAELPGPWDVVVIGGGISGAGILRRAARAGLRSLLLEAHDFAYGTSSRSSKLVHGGLRYLRQGRLRLMGASVHERERLLRDAPGLVQPLTFLLANFDHEWPPGWVYGAGLLLYDALALRWQHHHCAPAALLSLCPALRASALAGGYLYQDGSTDDARLVLRVLAEAACAGGAALNYARVVDVLRRRSGQVCGLVVRDETAAAPAAREVEVEASVVINATGAWTDQLRAGLGRPPRLRLLRGSHLVVPRRALPITQAVCVMHPADRRPVFFIPWQGVTLVGTTDVDHRLPLDLEPVVALAEADYLLAAVDYAFPSLRLSLEQVQAVYAGVRAVVNTGQANPSSESREHALWDEAGLLTVTGGKLTTYGLMAEAALQAARRHLPARLQVSPPPGTAPSVPPPEARRLDAALALRLSGRYGPDTAAMLAASDEDEFDRIGGTPACWAELRWAARAEAVHHLDDLLLRRVRLGLLLPHGGLACLDRIRAVVQPELGWDDARWSAEAAAYHRRWQASYSLSPAMAAEPPASQSVA
jgi:glycerol-3-phosphate dehydrogenase